MARAWDFAKDLYGCLQRHRVIDLSAIFAYWSLLALFPFAVFLLTIVGYLPLHGAEQELFVAVGRVMPDQALKLFERTVHEVVGRQRGGLLAVALLGALWSATGGMSSALTALNRAWGVEETRPWWRRKLLTLAMTIGAAGLMVVATTAMIVGPKLARFGGQLFGVGDGVLLLWRILRWPIAVVAAMVAVALVYYLLPNVKQRFRLFTRGSVVAVILWILVSAGFNAYVRHFHVYAKTYGTLGAAVVLMVWLYLTGLTVFLGGEINALVSRRARHPDAVARGPSTVTSAMPAVSLPEDEPLAVSSSATKVEEVSPR